MADLQFPVGISNFEKIREGGYYYIDKTNLISELLSGGIAEVTLITRPRRFGKSLGMSTLANFLNIRKDSKQMFEGLAISKNTELCKKWMNQCPVVFFSFKDTDGLTFEIANPSNICLLSLRMSRKFARVLIPRDFPKRRGRVINVTSAIPPLRSSEIRLVLSI